MVPAQAGLSLLQHVKYVGLSKERHYLVVVSWRERERERDRRCQTSTQPECERESVRVQTMYGIGLVVAPRERWEVVTVPTWSAQLLRVRVMLASDGGHQAVARSGHQRRPATPGHIRCLGTNTTRTPVLLRKPDSPHKMLWRMEIESVTFFFFAVPDWWMILRQACFFFDFWGYLWTKSHWLQE